MRTFLVLLLVITVVSWTGVHLSTPPSDVRAEFTVNAGESADAVARRLKAEGFIRSVALFKLAIKDSDVATKFQPGTYDLRGTNTYKEMAEKLTAGGLAANEMLVRVIEGWDLRDIKDHLDKIGFAAAGDFLTVTGNSAVDYRTHKGTLPADLSAEFDFLKSKPAYLSLEGYLFPDTYRVYKDATAKDLVRTQLKNFGAKLSPDLRAKAAANGRSIFDIVTMASVIEQEVREDRDRRLVSDLFWRRLDIGMALQADSTVNYVTGKGRAAISYEDTRLDSLYNTYKHPGLPLGPICNPGLSSLTAAVDPLPNDYWYFLTDEEGTVYYGKTLEEHNENKRKYLK